MSLLANYAPPRVTFQRGEGCELIDGDGNRYLDMIGGIAVCALGHANREIAEAVAEQARTLVHCSNLFGHEPAIELAAELARRSGFGRAFFCNSGTEANEAAIKLARKFAHRNGQPERKTILSCSGGFHGRTLGALAATANAAYHEGFDPLPLGFSVTPFNDSAALERALDSTVAAFIIEPVQGESGVNCATPEFLAAARRLCSERGALLIFDEIQCGMGRIGPTFAFEHFGVRPDLVTMAKALANGLPIGAMLVAEKYAEVFRPGDHGSTFGGSPVPCAAALAHLRIRDRIGLERHVLEMSAFLRAGLSRIAERRPDMFEYPRGLGLLLGLPLKQPHDAATIVEAALPKRLLLNKGGNNTLRFAPPLIIDSTQLQRALDVLEALV